jgi:ubiquinone/menaquinone biosynthesis C-methylase UbiE
LASGVASSAPIAARASRESTLSDFDDEIERARRVYTERAGNPTYSRLYGAFAQANFFTVQEREWVLADLLRRSGLSSLADMDILDVGCGAGGELRRMTIMGADPERLVGIDLMPARIESARKAMPASRFEVGSAHELPFPDASFDLVSQYVVFSSVAHLGLRQAIAREMLRVLRPEGRILWYDIKKLRPTADLVPIDLAEIKSLFPGCAIEMRPVTLGWRASHSLVPRSRTAALLAQKLPGTKSHYAGLIRPKPVVAG